jgi:hypothetical protein
MVAVITKSSEDNIDFTVDYNTHLQMIPKSLPNFRKTYQPEPVTSFNLPVIIGAGLLIWYVISTSYL